MSVPVLLLPYLTFTIPPALKKYVAAVVLAKVTVLVNVIVHAAVPEPVPEVLLAVPVQPVNCVP